MVLIYKRPMCTRCRIKTKMSNQDWYSKVTPDETCTERYAKSAGKGIVSTNWILGAIIYMYIGFSDTRNFCGKDITFTKVDGIVTENPLILDTDSLLGSSGSIILWFRICGISRVVIVILQLLSLTKSNTSVFATLMSLYLLFVFGMSVYGLHLIFGKEMPQQCIDYEMGNNLAYVVLYSVCIIDLIMYSLLALFVSCLTCCLPVFCAKLLDGDVSIADIFSGFTQFLI